jgi:hypothetical protein
VLRAHADYDAVGAALEPQQLATLRAYARTQRLRPEEWSKIPLCCAIAIPLAVENVVRHLREIGLSEKDALIRAAAQLDLDFETLQRRRRLVRQRTAAGN